MELGITMMPAEWAIRPDDLAREVEARGFGSLFLSEHTHIPVSRRTPWPGGGPLPEEYKHTFDPFVGLSMAAAVTTTLRLGTGVCLVAQRDAIVLAKEVASLDVLSGGRVVLGVGVGWNEDEMEDHGVDPARRHDVVREKVLAMNALWTREEAGFSGEFVRFSTSWAWPKPAQRPRPPVLFGGAPTPRTFRAVIDYCDGWLPIEDRFDLPGGVSELRHMAEQAGRDPSTLAVSVFASRGNPRRIEQYLASGVERVVFWVPAAGRDEVLSELDRYAQIAALVA